MSAPGSDAPPDALLSTLLGADVPPEEQPGFDDWWPRWLDACEVWGAPIDRAIAAGFDADRVAWAFAAGYQAALRRLDPTLSVEAVAALCVTEESGRPRDILTSLIRDGERWRLRGSKRFVSLADRAAELLVAARTGEADGRPTLKLVRVRRDDAGVSIAVHPPLPFTPEANHGSVTLDATLDADRLYEGDGYTRYVKPFRSIEDLHVTAAVLAHLLRFGLDRRWPDALLGRLVNQLQAARALAALSPADPALHIALDGYLSEVTRLVKDANQQWTDGDGTGERWLRDSPLLTIAQGARERRTLRAWEAFR